MQNTNLISYIVSYLKEDDVYPTWLLINKKFNKIYSEKWNYLLDTKKPKYDMVKYFYNLKKSNPEVNVKLDFYSNNIFDFHPIIDRHGGIKECITFQIKVSPVYPGHKVFIRYTLDDWNSFKDLDGWWMLNQDNIEFWRIELWLKEDEMKNRLSFAICCMDIKHTYNWDSNNRNDYYIDYPRGIFRINVYN